jgi:hypothetical protein
MSIDRIGKGAGITGPQAPATTEIGGAKRPFEVPKAGATSGAEATNPAERVRNGQLDVNGYLDVRVNEATSHLEGKLGPTDLANVRESLRAQLENDPALREMVQAATGAQPPSDDA